jgi:hypothetical protein
MRFYHLSEQRVKRVLNSPKRVEEGIAPNTIALMQPAGSKKHPYEVWVMVQNQKSKVKSQKLKIISAWKYPGRTKPGEPLPEEILREIRLAGHER